MAHLTDSGTIRIPAEIRARTLCSDRWEALAEAEQKAIYADYTEATKSPGVTPGLPLGLPDAARTVHVGLVFL